MLAGKIMSIKIGKKSGLKYFNVEYIRSLRPCYNPIRYIKEDFRGTVIDILSNDSIPFDDRLWLVLRTDLVSKNCMRLFAAWCTKQMLCNNFDLRAEKALDKSERSVALLAAAGMSESAARSAAWSAVRLAKWYKKWSALWSAADSARLMAELAQRDKLIDMIKTEGIKYIKNKTRQVKL